MSNPSLSRRLAALAFAAALVFAACGAKTTAGDLASAAPGGTAATTANGDTRLPGEPDPLLTPGVTNSAVTQANIASTTCKSGWTATVRPSVSYTDSLKRSQIKAYGYANADPTLYEEDHLISLELGGSPTDPHNLWPEPYTATLADGRSTGAHVKDQFENRLRSQVCAGTLSLASAQQMIGDHWVHYALGLPLSATSANPSTLSAAPSTAPAASASPENPTGSSVPGLEVVIVAFTEAVPAGAKASLTVKTAPNAACTIAVIYASGPSKAKGLEPKSSDPTGQVSWTWIVGSSTTPGDRSVTVTCAAGGRSGSVDETLAVE